MLRNFAIVPLVFSCSLAAQIIGGTVVDSVSRKPVAGATVDVKPWKSGKAAYHTTSDDLGNFRIENAAPGVYGFECTASGYMRMSRGPVQVVGGGTVEPLELLLVRSATVSVRVVDAHGKPASGATLRIGTPGSIAINATNGGKFEMQWPPAEPFTLAADPPSGSKAPDRDPQSGRAMAWVRTYYPGTAVAGAAAKILLQPGEQREIEIKLLAMPARAIRGVVLNPDGTPASGVNIGADDGWSGCTVESGSSGTFEVPCVVDGQWILTAEAQRGDVTLGAGERIDLLGQDAEGVKLYLSPPFTLRGRIAIEVPPGAQVPAPRPLGLAMRNAPRSPAFKPDGAYGFSFEDVYPGPYQFRAPFRIADQYYLDAIYYGDDPWPATGSSAIHILSGSSAITVVYETNGGTVRGIAANCGSGSVALIAPDQGWLAAAPCDAQGHYEIAAVRPGEYNAVAVPFDLPPSPMLTPVVFREALSKATPVTVKAGQVTVVDLRTIPWSDY